MSHFAKIDENNTVIQVAVGDDALPEEGKLWFEKTFGGRWIKTSYNGNIRKNFAGIGFYYDESKDAFIPPRPYESWVLNEETCLWEPPKQVPDDSSLGYDWSEELLDWVPIDFNLN
jgi:hypothetical protein